jgi:transposase
LLKNLREALERLLGRKHRWLKQAAEVVATGFAGSRTAEAPPKGKTRGESRVTAQWQQRRERRQSRYEQVVELYRQGASLRAIAHHFGMHRRTVRRFVRAESFPERARPKRRPSGLDPYRSFLEQHWQRGCHNAARLWRELRQQGFRGSQSIVRKYLAQWRTHVSGPEQANGCSPGAGSLFRFTTPSPRKTSWLLLQSPEDYKAEEAAFVDRLSALCPEIHTAKTLARGFAQMVHSRQPGQLDPWLKQAAGSHLPELESFAKSLEKDKPAVQAALRLEWSNGQVEGQVHRLKVVKRQMFGRAKLDLLRARLLHAA